MGIKHVEHGNLGNNGPEPIGGLENYLMQSLFMYNLQSDNCLILPCFYLALSYFMLRFTSTLYFALPCVSSLYWCLTPFISTMFYNDHTTGCSIPVSKFTGPAGSPTMQYID